MLPECCSVFSPFEAVQFRLRTGPPKFMNQKLVSISPTGEEFALPLRDDYPAEFARLENLANEHRAQEREIVVVVGLGFVGAVMAAVIADATDKRGRPSKFVIGMQRPSTRSFWKTPLL